MIAYVEVKRVRDAQDAYCRTCDAILGCQYWHFSKSAAMHRRGTGHTVVLVALAEVPD